MKSCKDCKWLLKSKFRSWEDRCGHRNNKYFLYTKERRLGNCGYLAVNWEAKNDI